MPKLKLTKKQRLWMLDELRSFLTTMASFVAFDFGTLLLQVFNGPWNKMLLWQFGMALLRSSVKSLMSMIWPTLFPRRSSEKVES